MRLLIGLVLALITPFILLTIFHLCDLAYQGSEDKEMSVEGEAISEEDYNEWVKDVEVPALRLLTKLGGLIE